MGKGLDNTVNFEHTCATALKKYLSDPMGYVNHPGPRCIFQYVVDPPSYEYYVEKAHDIVCAKGKMFCERNARQLKFCFLPTKRKGKRWSSTVGSWEIYPYGTTR